MHDKRDRLMTSAPSTVPRDPLSPGRVHCRRHAGEAARGHCAPCRPDPAVDPDVTPGRSSLSQWRPRPCRDGWRIRGAPGPGQVAQQQQQKGRRRPPVRPGQPRQVNLRGAAAPRRRGAVRGRCTACSPPPPRSSGQRRRDTLRTTPTVRPPSERPAVPGRSPPPAPPAIVPRSVLVCRTVVHAQRRQPFQRSVSGDVHRRPVSRHRQSLTRAARTGR